MSAKRKTNPLADPDEERLAQSIAEHLQNPDGYADMFEELALVDTDEVNELIVDHTDVELNSDDSEFELRCIAQRMLPYSEAERQRVGNRADRIHQEYLDDENN